MAAQEKARAYIEKRLAAAEALQRDNVLGSGASSARRRHGLRQSAAASLEAAAQGNERIDSRFGMGGRPTKAALLRRAGGGPLTPTSATTPVQRRYLPAVEFTGVIEASLSDPRPQQQTPLQQEERAATAAARSRRPARPLGLPRMHALTRSLPHCDGGAPQPQSCNICGSGNLCTVDCCRYCGSLCDTVPRSKNHAVLRQLVERYGRHAASLGVGAEGAAVSRSARGDRAEELLTTLLDRLELMLLGSAAGEGEGDRDNALRWSEELGLIGAPSRSGQLHHRSQPPAFLQAAPKGGSATGGAGDGVSSSSSGGGASDASAGYERPRFFYWDGRDASDGVGLAGADPKGLRTLLVALLLAPLDEPQQDRALAELRLNARTRLLVRSAAARLGGMEAKRHWATVQDALARLGKNDIGALLLDLTGALVAAGKAAPAAATAAAPARVSLTAASPKAAAAGVAAPRPVVSEQVQQVAVPSVDMACGTRSEGDELQRAAVAEGASRLAGGAGAKGMLGARAVLALLDRAVVNSVGVPLEAGNDDESRIAAHARAAAREAVADVAATLSSPTAGGGGVMGHCASLAFLLRRLQAVDDPENVLPVPELQMPPPGLMGGCLVMAEDPAEACARTLLHGVTDETRDALLHAWFHGQELQVWIAENAPELLVKARNQVVLVRAKKTEEEVAEEEARKLELLEKQAAAAGKVLRNRRSLAARLTAFAVGSGAGGDDVHRESTVPPAARPRRMSRAPAPDPAAIAIARRASSLRRKPQMHDASCQTEEADGAGEWGDALPELKRGNNNATSTLMERLDRTRRKTMRSDSPKKKTRSKKKSQDLDNKVADFDWTIKQVLALFEKRAEAEAAIKASTRRGAGASAQGMADFVYDDFIRQFGIPALARRKMQELLEALDVHASNDNPIVACFLEVLNDSAAPPDGEEGGDGGDGAAPREADLLANFVTDAILAVREEVATNVVFPPEAGETRINWIAESRSRKLLPLLFHGRWGLEGADKAAVVAAIKVQRTRGAGRWRLERHAGYQLAKTWRLSLLHFVQVVVTDFKRQLRAHPVSRGTMIREEEDAMTRAVLGVAEGEEGEEEEEEDDDDDDDEDGGDEGTSGRGVNENELLISNSIFSSANDECRALIRERCSLVHFDPGQVIMRKGDPADEMFIVKHGEVEVRVAVGGGGGVEKVVGTLSAPDFFGESALMEKGGRRTATISVPAAKRVTFSGGELGAAGGGGGGGGGPPARRSGVDLLKLTRADFDEIMDANPAFQEELRARNAGYIVIERVPMFQGRGRAFTYVRGSSLARSLTRCFRGRSPARSLHRWPAGTPAHRGHAMLRSPCAAIWRPGATLVRTRVGSHQIESGSAPTHSRNHGSNSPHNQICTSHPRPRSLYPPPCACATADPSSPALDAPSRQQQ
jgi:CRP-like cAMP-binding protein